MSEPYFEHDGPDEDPSGITEDASTLGWAPGHWPQTFEYDGQVMQRLHLERDDDGDINFAVYAYDGGTLTVFND
jgi:hypothetical protein